MDKHAIGARIKHIREILGLTQRDFSRMVGRSNASISGYELGDSFPTIDVLVKIANLGGVSIEWLIQGLIQPGTPEKTRLDKDEARLLNAFHLANDKDKRIIVRIAEALAYKRQEE